MTAVEYIRSRGRAGTGSTQSSETGKRAMAGLGENEDSGQKVLVRMRTVRGGGEGEASSVDELVVVDRESKPLRTSPADVSAALLAPIAGLSSGARYQESKALGTFVRAVLSGAEAQEENDALSLTAPGLTAGSGAPASSSSSSSLLLRHRVKQMEADERRSRPRNPREPLVLRSEQRRWRSGNGPAVGSTNAKTPAAFLPPLRGPGACLTPHTYVHSRLAARRARRGGSRQGRGGSGSGSGGDDLGSYWESPFFKTGASVDGSSVSPEVRLERSIISSGRIFTWGGRLRRRHADGASGVRFDPNRTRLLAHNTSWT